MNSLKFSSLKFILNLIYLASTDYYCLRQAKSVTNLILQILYQPLNFLQPHLQEVQLLSNKKKTKPLKTGVSPRGFTSGFHPWV